MRNRVKRRARQRLEQKDIRDVWRVFADQGLAERIRRANVAVAPESAFFWHAFKLRLAAREARSPVRTPEEVRDVAMAILAEEGLDLTGVVLKVTWRPDGSGRGQLFFEAGAEHEQAVDAVLKVRGSGAGLARYRARRMLVAKV